METNILNESIKKDDCKSDIKLKLLRAWKKIAIFYNELTENCSLIILFIITLFVLVYLDIYIAPKYILGIEILNKFPVAFLVFAVFIVYTSYLIIYLLFTMPFANNFDKKLLSISLGIFIYKASTFYTGEQTFINWTVFLCIVFFIFGFFLIRWGLASLNMYYMKNIKKPSSEYINNDSCFKADKPIGASAEDNLKRSNYANELAKAIISYEEKDSLVVAITGEWGSGKSSIINMSIESIEKSFHDHKYVAPTIVRFLPWNFSNQNQLLDQFFKSMSYALKANNSIIQNHGLDEKISAYATMFGKLLAVYGGDVTNFSGFISGIKGALLSADMEFAKSFLETKKSLEDALQNLPGKIIIFIDDIDRLNSSEIRQIFQLVKTIADFPNTMYVLSFDNKVVTNILGSEQKHLEASNYIEKIVQVKLEIPLATKEWVEQILFNGLNPLISDVSSDLFNINHWENVYQKGLKQYIKNIRDVKRLLNSMIFQYMVLVYKNGHERFNKLK